MTFPQAVTAQLIDTDGTTVVSGTPLSDAFDISFLDELSGVGTGQLSLSLSDAGAAELDPGRFCQILVDGTARFTFQIEGDPQYSEIAEGEEIDQVVTVSGRGWGCLLDQTIVYPENLTLNLDTSWRVFSFASPTFPNAGAWSAAAQLYEYLDGVSYGKRYEQAPDSLLYPSPISFPLPTSPNIYDPASPPGASYVNTYWIWPTGQETSIGTAFFRRTLTIATGGVYTFAITADNYFTLFLEGTPILGENADMFIWKGWKEIAIPLASGTYQIGVIVENVAVPDLAAADNPGGMIMTVHTVDGAQLPDAATLVTDNNWVCDWATTVWPGWTPGQIFLELISEATTRGALSAYNSSTFAALTDSASNAWSDSEDSSPYIPYFAVDVGGTIFTALDKAVAEGHIEWHMQPGALNLDIWAPSSLGASSGVTLAAGTNLMSLERGATAIYANALLVQWEQGYIEVTDAAEITARGERVEDVYSSEASTEDEATRQGSVELARRVQSGYPAIIVGVEPTSSADAPYTGYDLGETVNVPAVGGGTENVRVLSIGLSTDADGNAIWTSELNNRWRVPEQEDDDLLRQIGGRSGYSTGRVR